MYRTSLKHIDLEDETLVRDLFTFYEGTGDKPGTYQRSAMPMSVKIKIASVLLRSKRAASMFPSTLKVIFDCAYGTNATEKSCHISIEFARWVLLTAEDQQVRVMGPAILSGLFKILRSILFTDNPSSSSIRGACYGTIPLVCKRLPGLFVQHFDRKYLRTWLIFTHLWSSC